jgi:hypothetical protein
MYDAEYSSSRANLSTTTTSQSATLMNVTTSSSTNSTNSRFNSRSLSAFVESTNRNSIKKITSNNDNTPVSIKTLANKQQQPVKAEEERLRERDADIQAQEEHAKILEKQEQDRQREFLARERRAQAFMNNMAGGVIKN